MFGNLNPKESTWKLQQRHQQRVVGTTTRASWRPSLLNTTQVSRTYNKKNHKKYYSPAKLVPWLLVCSNTISYILSVPIHTYNVSVYMIRDIPIYLIYINMYRIMFRYILCTRFIIIAPPQWVTGWLVATHVPSCNRAPRLPQPFTVWRRGSYSQHHAQRTVARAYNDGRVIDSYIATNVARELRASAQLCYIIYYTWACRHRYANSAATT